MLEQLVNILSCPHSSCFVCWAVFKPCLKMELIITAGLSCGTYCCNTQILPWPPRAYICIQGCGSASCFCSSPAKRKKSVVLVHRGRSKAQRGPGPAQSVISFGLVWDCEVTQNYGDLFAFRVQRSLKFHISWKLQVLSALMSYIANVQFWEWRRDVRNQ